MRALCVLSFVAACCGLASAQWNEFSVGAKTVQVHGFLSQGFAVSDQNNFLTMKTSNGSFAFTDFGFNASSQLTDNFRVGAQIYDRNIGVLGKWHPQLDWAYGDYKLKDWLGIRAGKVKTVLGLYNDTQDVDSLHTFALLPQSVYPTDLRGSTIAHTGVDLYGAIGIESRGEIAYTAYTGALPFDRYGGYPHGTQALGVTLDHLSTRQTGGDLRWNNLTDGLTFGISFITQPYESAGTVDLRILGLTGIAPYEGDSMADHRTQFYTEYRRWRLTLQGEYYRETWGIDVKNYEKLGADSRGWYAAAAYRVAKRLEFGTYHSRYYPDWKQADLSLPTNHIFDQAITANITLNSFWGVKLEGHFMDGYGEFYSFRGFYPQDNPQGLKPHTNLFVIRTGFNF